ncbi:MAG: endonuclease III [Deltaproteobacteria bacterium]|nr:endonuclease III [Deltaproteobacteria bacterium]
MPPKTKKQTSFILKELLRSYPDVHTQLRHENPFQLLCATILSAQCTDKQVNAVTPALFARFKRPQDFADADILEIEEFIRPTGFFHSKAKKLKDCAEKLIAVHGGVVPNDMEALLALPGVGRKTANVVDTHVKRISFRLGLTENTDPEKIEYDLMEALPKKTWIDFSLWLIYHGRAVCTARKPKCPDCTLKFACPKNGVENA